MTDALKLTKTERQQMNPRWSERLKIYSRTFT